MNYRPILQPQITEAALKLGQNLTCAELFVRFRQAEHALNDDVAACGLLTALTQAQAKIRKAQANGSVIPEDLQALSDLQAQIQANPFITDYTTCKQELTAFLQGINTDISQLLGVNFAILAKHSTCC